MRRIAWTSIGPILAIPWATSGSGARFGLIVHPTDADREIAYDRQSAIGKLDKALDAAGERRWTVVDMKSDWKTVFAAK